jgi:conjugal transfer pilus assembly protein TraL
MEPLPFPHHADSKARLLIWTPDQVIPMACMFVVGVLTDTLTLSIVVGFVLSWAYTRYSEGKPDGFLVHVAYWHGLAPLRARCALNPFLRRILPL